MRTLRFALALFALAAPAAARATVCPGPSTVEGIDVSEYQGNINWSSVKSAGKEFAIIRVGDGMYVDPYFAANWTNAKAAGVIRGAYQFFEPGEDAVQQANLFLQKMGTLAAGDLPPMLDVEVTGGQSGATITSKIHQWINTVQAATGRVPMIYTGTWFWDPNVGSSDFSGNPLVESWYCSSCCPSLPNAWSNFKMWQYADNGAVSGISGNVDLDKFNGTMADLQKFAGGNVDWSASFVSQSFPYATDALTMTVNQSLPAYIELKNTGAKNWDANTRLGTTQPRDRASSFAAGDWLGPNRPSSCTSGASPGQSYKFTFTLQAPNKPGTYFEYFGVVQEGVHWFSDSGEGGPPDDQLEAQIVVVEADYHAEFVAQSYIGADQGTVPIALGDSVDGWIDLKNVGNQTWKAGEVKLAPTPRDVASGVAADNWLSPTRVSTVAMDVAPGAVGRFPLKLSGSAIGDYNQTFGLVDEGVTWFADAPKGGGPPDDFLRVHVVVGPATATANDAGVIGVPSDDGGAPYGDPPTGPMYHAGASSGCSFAGAAAADASGAAGDSGSPALYLILFGIAVFAFAPRALRRRR